MAKGLQGRTVSRGERGRLTHTLALVQKTEKKENRGVEGVAGHEGNNLWLA